MKAILLGLVQGLTEFLPISSSGHLVITSHLLDFQGAGVAFDIFVHFGTLVAVIVVFRKELTAMVKAPFALRRGTLDEETRTYFLWDIYVVVATIPAVFAGLLLKDSIEEIFSSLTLVYAMLALTGVLMLLTRKLPERGVVLNCPRSLVIGCAQAMAILPGLSRSGSTIFAGMALGVDREVTARFSFIMSIPAILGAVVLQMKELIGSTPDQETILCVAGGTIAAMASGYAAIILLLEIVRRNRLVWFGYYCLLVSALGFGSVLLS
ncbi:MAG: undecaprenyl-diphosphate phosphatase [Thermodesulfobacteriota bacterium]